MKVIIDLNVVLDVLQNRAPHYRSSAEVLSLARAKAIEAIIPSHAVTTIYYVVAKSEGKSKADFAVDWLLANVGIAPVGSLEFQKARQLGLPDFEDAVVASLAVSTGERNLHPSLRGADGTESRLPQPIFEMLMKVIDDLHQGRAVVLMPEEETFTTQAAANYLGMSRQFFATLLESGQIPFHRVGSHRRVYFKDLRDYSRKRDGERRTGMKRLFHEVKRAGLYDASYSGIE